MRVQEFFIHLRQKKMPIVCDDSRYASVLKKYASEVYTVQETDSCMIIIS